MLKQSSLEKCNASSHSEYRKWAICPACGCGQVPNTLYGPHDHHEVSRTGGSSEKYICSFQRTENVYRLLTNSYDKGFNPVFYLVVFIADPVLIHKHKRADFSINFLCSSELTLSDHELWVINTKNPKINPKLKAKDPEEDPKRQTGVKELALHKADPG